MGQNGFISIKEEVEDSESLVPCAHPQFEYLISEMGGMISPQQNQF